MSWMRSIAVLVCLVAAPLLACGQSGASAQGSVNQVLGSIAKGVAAQAWSGTLKIDQAAQNSVSEHDIIHNSTATQKATNVVTITLTNGIAAAQVAFDLHEVTDIQDHYDGYEVIRTIKEDTVGAGLTKDAQIKVSLNDDGTYEIEYSAGGVTGQYTKVQTTQKICKGDPSCTPSGATNTQETAQPTKLGYAAGGVNGTYGKNAQPKALSGSTTEPWDLFSGTTASGKTTTPGT